MSGASSLLARGSLAALQYLNDERRGTMPCEHGHIGCACWEGGPCSDELEQLAESQSMEDNT